MYDLFENREKFIQTDRSGLCKKDILKEVLEKKKLSF